MRELAEADRGRVAIAGNAEIDQIAVGEVAPVKTDGMRPWTELKPCELPRK
jgi:hypothetical protein